MAKLVGARPATAISEIVNEDGSMARGEALQKFAQDHDIPIFSMQELITYAEGKLQNSQSSLADYAWAKLPRANSQWEIAVHVAAGGAEHAIMRLGKQTTSAVIRLHSECLTGDALGSLRCDCGDQLEAAFSEIERRGSGYIIYLRDHEGRGIGLSEKIAAYALQDQGMDTVDANVALGHQADERDWNDAVEIIKNLGVNEVTLLTNNPLKSEALKAAGLKVELAHIHTEIHEANRDYLVTKRDRMSHTLEIK
jgi:3,4-dihydroxy 2-butanone 4-phosphate synthase / GTP cyclohydrolase II